MVHRRRARHTNPVVGFFSKDPFGVTWFSLLYLALIITKWWYIAPPAIDNQNCLACVVAIVFVMAVTITLLLTAFWILWTSKRQKKALLFLFLICLGVIGCTALLDVATQAVFGKLYYSGMLSWNAADLSFLLDDFLHHASGLYLGVLMVYSMLRIAISSEFEQRKFVIPINLFFAGVAGFLLFIGVKLY